MLPILAPIFALFSGSPAAPAPIQPAAVVSVLPAGVAQSPAVRRRERDAANPPPPGFFKQGGLRPKEWGMSAACRRMVRASRLRRAGLSGSKI